MLANEVLPHGQGDDGTLFRGNDNPDDASTAATIGDDDDSDSGVDPCVEALIKEIFGPYDDDSEYASD